MKSKIEVLRAEKMGFCFGVKEAIDTCYRFLDEVKAGKRVFIVGELVHNEHVIETLKKEGFITLTEEDIINDLVNLTSDDRVIIRAHGTKKEIYDKLREKGVKIEDAACIFVKDIRKKMLQMEELGHEIIFIGDEHHPEVEGIVSFGEKVHIIPTLEELKKFNFHDKITYSLLTQTTLNKEKMKEIKNYLENTLYNVNIFNKICGATQERQLAVEKLAKVVDLVLIIGGKKSSNTKKLYEVSSNINKNTKLLTDETELDPEWFKDIKTVGLTAGASTPEEIINKIENIIKEGL